MKEKQKALVLGVHNYINTERFMRGQISMPIFKTYEDLMRFREIIESISSRSNTSADMKFSDMEGGEIKFNIDKNYTQ